MWAAHSVFLLERTCRDCLWFSLLQQGIHLSAATTVTETMTCSGSTQIHGWIFALEGHSSEFSAICLCVIDNIYLLIVSGTFRDSAGHVLFAESIFCCIRTMCNFHSCQTLVCAHLNFCNKTVLRSAIKLSKEAGEALFLCKVQVKGNFAELYNHLGWNKPLRSSGPTIFIKCVQSPMKKSPPCEFSQTVGQDSKENRCNLLLRPLKMRIGNIFLNIQWREMSYYQRPTNPKKPFSFLIAVSYLHCVV